MKLHRLLLFLMILPLAGKSQQISATYKVSQDIFGASGQYDKQKVATLESVGYYYKKDNRYIYFEKPSYLNDYHTGSITLAQNYNVGVCMDSLQHLVFVNTDSLIRIYRPHITGKDLVTFNFIQHYEPEFYNWELMNETKEINGLKCQKAEFRIKNNLQWIAWFAPSIPTQVGISQIIGLPGLIVSAEYVPVNTRYELIAYNIGKDIPEKIFHPKEFAEPYEKIPPFTRSATSNSEKSKIQKKAELTHQ